MDNQTLSGEDWSEIKENSIFILSELSVPSEYEKERLESQSNHSGNGQGVNQKLLSTQYFEKYLDLFGHTIPPFNLGIYQTTNGKREDILRATQYIGVMPLCKKDNCEIEPNKFISIRSRFSISPTEMLKTVLAGDDYYENPSMLKFNRYTVRELKEIKDKVLFGMVTDLGQVDLSKIESDTNRSDSASSNAPGIADVMGIFEVIDFIAKAKDVCKKTLKRQSETVEENLNCKVKGRILVNKQIKYNLAKGQFQRTYCAYQKMSENIKENQILRYALYLCEKLEISDTIMEDIAFCKRALAGVPVKKCSLSDFIGLKTNGAYRQYKPALEAAKRIIGRFYIAYEQGTGTKQEQGVVIQNYKVNPYFIDMNLLFEYYCRAIFRDAVNQYNCNFQEGNSLKLRLEKCGEEKELYTKNDFTDVFTNVFMQTYIPDLVIYAETTENESNEKKPILVLDAKYSPLEEQDSTSRRERTHQVLFYMKALGCNIGGLIGAKKETEENMDVKWQAINNKENDWLCYMGLSGSGAKENITMHINSAKSLLNEAVNKYQGNNQKKEENINGKSKRKKQ